MTCFAIPEQQLHYLLHYCVQATV